MKRIFITGISTDVGKTIASAIIAEALEADYWKPIQAGDLEYTDSDKVAKMIANTNTVIHKSSYALKTPMSPHAAATIDGVIIKLDQIKEPITKNHLVIEGAGGLLVPINDDETILDLIKPHYKVVVVSRHYLGSINHSLLTIGWLKERGFNVSVLFSGEEHTSTEQIILSKTGVQCIGRISEEKDFNPEIIKKYANLFRQQLMAL